VQLDSVAQAYIEAVWALPAMQEWVLAANNEVESIETIQL
jgi:glutathione S-transferase